MQQIRPTRNSYGVGSMRPATQAALEIQEQLRSSQAREQENFTPTDRIDPSSVRVENAEQGKFRISYTLKKNYDGTDPQGIFDTDSAFQDMLVKWLTDSGLLSFFDMDNVARLRSEGE